MFYNLIIAHFTLQIPPNCLTLKSFSIPQLSHMLTNCFTNLLSLRHVLLMMLRRLNINVLRLWGENLLDGLTSADDRLDKSLLSWHGVRLIRLVDLWKMIKLGAKLSW